MIDFKKYRAEVINERKNVIIPENIEKILPVKDKDNDAYREDLINSYRDGKAIENILLPLLIKESPKSLIISDKDLVRGIDDILQRFRDQVLTLLKDEEKNFHERQLLKRKKTQNIFEVANTINLYLSNKYTRVISENLGHKLEDIATLSPKIINPEVHFRIKIKGVDVILFENSKFYFTQLKTKKDTLTGSQKSRSESELSLFAKSKFVACLSMGSWTFNTKIKNIERIEGAEFWNKIDIDYSLLINKLSGSLNILERKLFPEK